MSITLAELEQETARRVGPYSSAFTDRQIPNTAQFTFANFPTLRSTIDLDSVTNLWMLRRGVTIDGTPVVFDIVDRQRLVADYDPEQGRIYPDRPWGTIPVPGEVIEFHHLDPEQQLRVAVRAGLRRCFFQDTLLLQPTSMWGDVDLTVQQPWITDPQQVTGAQYGWVKPYADAPFDTSMQGGHVMLTGTWGYEVPMSMWVTAIRPHWSWVNETDSTSGPTDDNDTLNVDLDYAASAAHIEAWHLFPSRLAAAAASGLQATQAMAAAEFTRQAQISGPRRNTTIGFRSVIGLRPDRGHWSHARTWVNR